MLQLPRGGAEAVEHVVLSDTVHPLPPGGEAARDEVSALTLPGTEAAHDLKKH